MNPETIPLGNRPRTTNNGHGFFAKTGHPKKSLMFSPGVFFSDDQLVSIRKLSNVILSKAKNLRWNLKQGDSSLRLVQNRLVLFLRRVLEQREDMILESRLSGRALSTLWTFDIHLNFGLCHLTFWVLRCAYCLCTVGGRFLRKLHIMTGACTWVSFSREKKI